MAKATNIQTGESREVPDGEKIWGACEELGVPFSCKDGTCGTCMIDVEEGEENLSELTEQEEDLGRDKKHRLACQCRIKHGEVKFDY
jgi:ferredoxin